MKLWTYTIAVDHGAAPNPYGGRLTLTICKPQIRRSSNLKIGDWIAAIGSKMQKRKGTLIAAFEVSEIMTLEEYDKYCQTSLQVKIPSLENFCKNIHGDCIIDFSSENPTYRRYSVHSGVNQLRTDRNGKNAILSDNWYYFGENAVKIPDHLAEIIPNRAIRSWKNNQFVEPFIDWIQQFNSIKNQLVNKPCHDDKKIFRLSDKLRKRHFG